MTDVTKKRKLEEGESNMTVEQVGSLISLWNEEQLRRVLAKIGKTCTSPSNPERPNFITAVNPP
jgi:hypothetical protein